MTQNLLFMFLAELIIMSSQGKLVRTLSPYDMGLFVPIQHAIAVLC